MSRPTMKADDGITQAPKHFEQELNEKPVMAQGALEQVDVDDAGQATAAEKSMGIKAAFKAYPKAVMWSMIFSTAIVMEGFDLTMINSFYALPAFQRKYGTQIGPDEYIITAAWQSGLSNAVQVGSLIGLAMNGWACDRFGYLRTMSISLVAIICFIFITFFAHNIEMLLVGELLCGIPWGVFQTLTTAYAAEVCPTPLRPYLTTYVNLCWVMGQFISSGVLKGVSQYDVNDEWAYRLPFALQWIWPVPILVASLFAPESPWYLVRKGRLDDARRSLQRISSNKPGAIPIDIEQRISQMQVTNEMEIQVNAGQTYLDLFKGVNLRRTEIVSMVWMIQTLAGSGFIGFSTVFYVQAGLNTSNSFTLSLCQYALGAIGTMSSWYTINRFGRRPLYLWGLVSMAVVLFATGCTGFKNTPGASWAAGSLVFFYSFLYQFTVGPVCYCLVAEIPSTRLRAKSVVFARAAYNVVGIINNILFPRMLSPDAWNWGKKAGFFWAGSNVLCIIWTFFRLPEPKDRTYAELDILFEERVSARKFRTTVVDVQAHAEKTGRQFDAADLVSASAAGGAH